MVAEKQVMKCAVAIFAKTPGLSPVKTRLAADIGQEQAETFYGLSVKAVEAVAMAASEQSPLVPHWALAEEAAITYPQWQGFPAFWTGEGGLGTRLANLSDALFSDHDAVMFLGTDSPQLTPSRLMEAVAMLKARPEDCICGPADDGGFYLFASSSPLKRETWESVTYSANTTLEELVMASGRKFFRLPVEQDVDVVADLVRLHSRFENAGTKLLPEQLVLKNWLDAYFDVAV